MDLKELKERVETNIWGLYQDGVNFASQNNTYSDSDLNFRMYNGDQWNGLKVKDSEKVQLNIIKPIIRYKVAKINQKLWMPKHLSENYDVEFRETGAKTCKLLDRWSAKVWEKDYLDYKLRKISRDAAINDECPVYVSWDKKTRLPKNEILSKNDVYYGNENDSDIQEQPYILIKRRMHVIEAQKFAEENGVNKEELEYIIGDQETLEESGDSAKKEKDNRVTVVTMFYKKDDTLHYAIATRYVEILKETDSKLHEYPLEHMTWEDKEGSARGEGETRNLIANQLELNKTLMRRAVVTKKTAYQQKVINADLIDNPDDIDNVGSVIEVKGGLGVQDVSKAFTLTQPAQMSSDVQLLQQDLINLTRQLAGAGDAASGDIDPEDASGKAIIAVQQAQEAPLTEQSEEIKRVIERLDRIWIDMLVTYAEEDLKLEEEVEDPTTGQKTIQLVPVATETLQELKATVKVEVTPKSPYDKFAQERTIENLFTQGLFAPEKLGQLKFYLECLDDDSVTPKMKLLQKVDEELKKQEQIAQINAQVQSMKQRATEFLDNDPDRQAEQVFQAQQSQ